MVRLGYLRQEGIVGPRDLPGAVALFDQAARRTGISSCRNGIEPAKKGVARPPAGRVKGSSKVLVRWPVLK